MSLFKRLPKSTLAITVGLAVAGYLWYSHLANVASQISISASGIARAAPQVFEISGTVSNRDFLDRHVQVKAIFYSKDGGIISASTHTIYIVPAGGSKPFSIYINNDISGYSRYELKILSAT